jgi:hypothetical protein
MMKRKTVLRTARTVTAAISLGAAAPIEGRVEHVHLPHQEYIQLLPVGNAAHSVMQTASTVVSVVGNEIKIM